MEPHAQAVHRNADLDPEALTELGAMAPEVLLRSLHERFGDRAAIGTSFQLSGMVLIDMAYRQGLALRTYVIDTLRLPPETYELVERVEERYGIHVERFKPDSDEVDRMVGAHGEHLFFDSVEKRMYCCKIRKDRPNARAMETLDAWITGVRRDDSEERRNLSKVQVSTKYGRPILKASPLCEWSRADVDAYLTKHEVPVNSLHAQGYPTLGCVICTSPVLPWEDIRAGRWRWEKTGSSKECGLHIEGGGGI